MAAKIRNILTKVINVVSVIIIICAVYILFTVVTTGPGKTPSVLGYSMFRVMSGSMNPTIRTNSLIIVKQTEASQLAVDDVISFYSHDPSLYGMVNTHRIVGIESDEKGVVFQTKGDANVIADKYPVPQDDVIGRVVVVSYAMGVAVRLLANPIIFIPFILVPMAGLIIWNLVKTISLTKKLAREEEEAAVREAIEAIKQKKKGEQSDGGSTED